MKVKKNPGDTGTQAITLNFYGPSHGSANWNSAQTVYVDVIDDGIDKGASWTMVQAIYFRVTSADPALNGKETAISNITVIATDNDQAVRRSHNLAIPLFVACVPVCLHLQFPLFFLLVHASLAPILRRVLSCQSRT